MNKIKINSKEELGFGIKRTYLFKVYGIKNNENIKFNGVITRSSFFPNPHGAYDDLVKDVIEMGFSSYFIDEFRSVI